MIPDNSPESFVPRLFSYGFRPMFLLAVLGALILIGWWLGVWYGMLPGPGSSHLLAWHGHEMVFGFVGAAVGGFLLTAVANWTRRPAVAGWRLALLTGCWIAARVVMVADSDNPPILVLLVDTSYWLLLVALLGWEIFRAKNYRNLKIVGLLSFFLLLNGLFHADAVSGSSTGSDRKAVHAAMFLVCVLIAVIGGRIIPAFTGNWLRLHIGPQSPMPVMFNWFDGLSTTGIAIAGVAWVIAPTSQLTGGLLLVCGVLHTARLARWQGHRTWREPLVIALHVGYAWLPAGFFLLAATTLFGVPQGAGIHALGVGAMSGLIIAVASRAAMGHTNRPLTSGYLLSAAFLLINLAALCRVAASVLDMQLLLVAGLLWCLAFLVFSARILPMLLGPKASRESLLGD